MYKNLHVGRESTITEMWIKDFALEDCVRFTYDGKKRRARYFCFRYWLQEHLFVILEHWSPKEKWTPDRLLDYYRDLLVTL